jgi:hypothetical protein
VKSVSLPILKGSLAQLVEQRTFNPLVPRSSRGRPINKVQIMQK